MKTAIWVLSIAVAVLAGLAIWQMTVIKRLTASGPADPGTRNADTDREKKTARFRDIVNAVQEELQPKEINIKLG